MADPHLIHIGRAAVDFIYRIDRLPGPGDWVCTTDDPLAHPDSQQGQTRFIETLPV